MTEEEFLQQQTGALNTTDSPGARAVAQANKEMEAERRSALDAEIEQKYRESPVKPAIDYKGAYADGEDFTAGPVSNKYVPYEGGPGLFGHDPSTGTAASSRFNKPEYSEPVAALSASSSAVPLVVTRGVKPGPSSANLEDTLPLGHLAAAAQADGMDASEYRRNVPEQWPEEMTNAAWEASTDLKAVEDLKPKLERLAQQEPIETGPAEYTIDEFKANPEVVSDARTLYKHWTEEEFTGSDAEAAEWMTDHLRWFDNNTVTQAKTIYKLGRSNPEVIQAYASVMDKWDKTDAEMTLGNLMGNIGRAIPDPTNAIGFGYGKVAATTATRMALKALLKEAGTQVATSQMKKQARKAAMKEVGGDLAKLGASGAVAGAIGEGLHEEAKQQATGQERDLGKIGTSAAGGAVMGAASSLVLNEGFAVGGRMIANAYRKARGKPDAPLDMEAVIGQILVDRANGVERIDSPSMWGAVNNTLDEALAPNNPTNVIYDQLIKAGRSEEEAAANAHVVGAWYTATAKHYDVTPEELFRRLPLHTALKGAQTPEGALNVPGRTGAGRVGGRSSAPLEGAPAVEGASGPDPRLNGIADGYAAANGLPGGRQASYVEVDEAFAKRLADAYEEMPHAPDDPVVKEAYENLIRQTTDQYQALEDAGYKFFFFDETNDPYGGNPWNAMRDLRENKRMGVFATEAGFGSGDTALDVSGNPLLADTGKLWPSGSPDGPAKRVLANDLFRAVHDAFGHGLEGAGFRARGEENAWQAHAKLFKGSALAALTTETRGQNSWLNYGPHGARNQTAKVEDTVFADQKTGLLPEWAWTENLAPVEATFDDFTPGKVKDILSKDNWAILTAENPGIKQLSPEENAQRMTALKRELDEAGIQYKETTGKYGNEENSLLITGVTKDQAAAIGQRWGQDSVLTKEGYSYHDGRSVPTTGKVEVFDTPPDDNFTTIRNEDGTETYFSIGLDFADDTVFNQSVSLRTGKETLKKYGLDPNKKHKTRDVAAALEARQREKYGVIAPTDRSPEAARKIGKWMAEEVQFELLNPEKSGAGWYGKKFQNALDIFAKEFPELADNQDARDILTSLIAITSDGQKVVPNFKQAVDIYDNYRKTGKLTTAIGHQRQGSIDNNMGRLQELLDTYGPRGMRDFLLQEATVSDLRKIAKAEGVDFKTDYQAHIKLPMGAVALGPKLGAFYANLMGSHGYLTMDRWWSRTVNRMRGTLLTKPTKAGIARVRELLGDANLSDDEVIAASVAHRNSYEAKNFKNGTELEKAANTLYKAAFEALEDTPFNASDRTFMLDAVNKAQSLLKRRGHDVSVADIQAMLWYYEKRLYGDLGARQTADISYEDAARKVIEGRATGAGGPDARGLGEGAPEQVDGALPGDEDFLNQGPKGTYNPGTAVVTLLESADQSTFAHESAHHFLEMTTLMAQSPGAPAALKRDLKKTLNWLGSNPEEWASMTLEQKRSMHEKYARGFEQYLREGAAPTKMLERSFSAFKEWLTRIYISADELGSPINDEIRGVFDRMLGGGAPVGPVSATMRTALPVLGGGDNQGVLNQFAGKNSVMSNTTRSDLATAEKALADGADPETVRFDTGWFRGKDGVMRYEISDKNAVAKEMNMPAVLQVPRNELRKQAARDVLGDGWETADRSAPEIRDAITNRWEELADEQDAALQEWANRPIALSDVIDHPELFRAYPGMANMKVELVPMHKNDLGMYNPKTDTITLNGQPTQRKLLDSQKSTLLHEIQHAIQQREGFARGGSPQTMKWDDYSPKFQQSITEARERAREHYAAGNIKDMETALETARGLTNDAQYEAYKRLLGEIEARDTQWRAGMDDTDRRIMTPDQGKDAIIVFNQDEIPVSSVEMPTQQEVDALNKAAQAILGQDTAKLLRDALEADELPMPGKYINTGTINTERLHPGAAMAKDPGRFVGQVENAEDLAKLMNYIGEGLELSEPPRTHGEVARTASLLDLEPLLRGEQTGLASDRQLYAMRSMVATLGDQTVNLSKKITAGDHSPETLLEYEKTGQQLIAMQKLLTGNVREVARALSQQRMIATVLSADDIKALERSMNEATDPGALINNAKALAKQLENGKDPMEALAKSLKRRTWLEAGIEFWTANILTNPTTHMVNMVSGLALDAWHIGIVKPLAGAIGSTRSWADLGADERITLTEAAVSISAGTRAIADGLRGMVDVLKTNQSEFDRVGRGSPKLETTGALGTKLGGKFGKPGEIAAEVLTPAFRLLRAEDELFKTIAYRSEIAGLATRSGIMAGLEGDALKAHAANFLKNPPEEAHKAALQKADELTLQDTQMGGGVIGVMGMEARKLTSRFPVLKFLMPFITTPVNAVATGLESSMFSILSTKLWRDIAAGGAASDMAIAKVVSGTALTGVAYMLYQGGLLTGSGPENAQQKKLLMATGWRPNSVRIGDKYVDINRLDPFGAALASVAGAMDRATFERRDLDMVREFSGAVAAFSSRMLDLPFLQGAKDLIDSFEYGLSSAPYMASKIASGFIPYAGAVAGIARIGDQETGEKVATRPSELGMGGMGTVQDMVYIASQQVSTRMPWARDGLRPARYWDGSVIMPSMGTAAALTSPFRTSEAKQDKLTEELVGNGVGYSEAPPAVTLAGVTLSVLEFDKLRGMAYDRMLIRIGEARRELVSEVVNSAEYADASAGPGSERASALTRAMAAGRRAGEMQFLTEDLPAMIKSGEIDANEIARQVGEDPETFFSAALAGELAPQPGNRMKIRGGASARPITPSGTGVPKL